jgi:hypothetical protein
MGLFKEGHIAWNKGLTKELDARVERNAKGISQALRGENNPHFNPHKKTLTTKIEKLEKRRKYETPYRNENRELRRRIDRASYERHKNERIEKKRAYRIAHPEVRKMHYKNNREELLKESKERAAKLRLAAISNYSNGTNMCSCCKESHIEFLTIDHLPNAPHKRDNKKKKGGREIFYWLKKNNYPDGFRVLCMNCNFSHGKYGYCPHQKEVKEQ